MGSGAKKQPTELGRRLRAHYEERGLTRADFAARIGVTEQSVINWEVGDASPSTPYAVRIARETGWPVEEITNRPNLPQLPRGASALLREFAATYLHFAELSGRQIEQLVALEFSGTPTIERLTLFADTMLGYAASTPSRREETEEKARAEGVRQVGRKKRS